jgi:hypothetical protein
MEREGSETVSCNDKIDVHQHRLRGWPSRWRCLLLRLALGRHTFEYMLRSIKADPRMPDPYTIDIVVRKDAVEKRWEAQWIATIARMTYHLPAPPLHRKRGWLIERLDDAYWWTARRFWPAHEGAESNEREAGERKA